MERRLVEGNQIISAEVMSTIGNISSISFATTSTTSTTQSMNETLNQKLKRIQPAISRSRSGENGTACSAHKDCRPGHCCHRFVLGRNETQPVCVLHRLTEGAECVDGCQCSTQLNCFLPDARLTVNSTNAVCKKAASSDILTGSYLYQKDSVIVVNRSK
ncbi:hypothetical protein GCK32_016639 [Trichostrongylus colubriformis]|uniref:Uncharacterized protein n=1 Tax=Trichostrongylus colubriformis TaxID=6319 RepID=A0AAN8IGG8_TRICO